MSTPRRREKFEATGPAEVGCHVNGSRTSLNLAAMSDVDVVFSASRPKKQTEGDIQTSARSPYSTVRNDETSAQSPYIPVRCAEANTSRYGTKDEQRSAIQQQSVRPLPHLIDTSRSDSRKDRPSNAVGSLNIKESVLLVRRGGSERHLETIRTGATTEDFRRHASWREPSREQVPHQSIK
jgi:hypothetical protein